MGKNKDKIQTERNLVVIRDKVVTSQVNTDIASMKDTSNKSFMPTKMRAPLVEAHGKPLRTRGVHAVLGNRQLQQQQQQEQLQIIV